MATTRAAILSKQPVTGSSSGHVLAATGSVTSPIGLAANDILSLCILPADHVPVDFILESADLDTNASPAITLTVAVLNADETDVVASTSFITASAVAQAGGVARAAVVDGLQLAASNTDRIIGVKCIAAGLTKAAGLVRGTLFYRRK